MGSLNYIPFHDAITQGDKRGIARATRFIYLELTMAAKPFGGHLPLPRGFKTDLDAVEDILGGNRREIAAAIATLIVPLDPTDPSDRSLITIEGPPDRRVLSIVAYPDWSAATLSTPRVRKYRNKQTKELRGDRPPRNAFPAVSETSQRNAARDVSETRQKEEKGREEKRRETPVVPTGDTGSPSGFGASKLERVVDVGTARCEAVSDAFVATLAELGWARPGVRDRWERQTLCDAINAHLRADGSADGILAELARAVREWVAAYADASQFTSGWGARKFSEWLSAGRPRADRKGTGSLASEPEDAPRLDTRRRTGPPPGESFVPPTAEALAAMKKLGLPKRGDLAAEVRAVDGERGSDVRLRTREAALEASTADVAMASAGGER